MDLLFNQPAEKIWEIATKSLGINIIDISNVLDNTNELSYVDGVHYSPFANKIIANKIYLTIKDKFNDK